jgi:hypothetical protein
VDEAQRLVEALITAGCDERDVSVFRTREMQVQVAYSATIRLGRDDSANDFQRVSEPVEIPSIPIDSSEQAIAPVATAGPATTGGWGLHLRADRFVWMCLWAVSIVVLAASLVTTFSRPAPREFVPGAPTSDAQGLAPDGAALDSSSSPATDQTSVVPECALAGQDNCQCSDFGTQADAQVFYERYPAANGHIVDTDGDGVFCEWLATPAAPPGQ